MSLYPITTLDATTAGLNPNGIMPGTLIVIPIDMTTVQMTSFDLQHLSNTQDYSLRAWLSKYPDGVPIPSSIDGVATIAAGIYAIIKFSKLPMVIYIAGQTPPIDSFDILVSPGLYNLNILNLTNEVNVFGFIKTDLA
jgi:hypothetical protein